MISDGMTARIKAIVFDELWMSYKYKTFFFFFS